MSFDELQFDVKSTNFKVLKNTSNTIRSNVFSVIDVFYDPFAGKWQHPLESLGYYPVGSPSETYSRIFGLLESRRVLASVKRLNQGLTSLNQGLTMS